MVRKKKLADAATDKHPIPYFVFAYEISTFMKMVKKNNVGPLIDKKNQEKNDQKFDWSFCICYLCLFVCPSARSLQVTVFVIGS